MTHAELLWCLFAVASMAGLWYAFLRPIPHAVHCEQCGRCYTDEQLGRIRAFLGGGDPSQCYIPYCSPRLFEPDAKPCGGKLVI